MKTAPHSTRTFMLACCMAVFGMQAMAQQQPQEATNSLMQSYQGTTISRNAQTQEMEVILRITPPKHFPSQEVVCVRPIFVSADGTHRVQLQPVNVSGSTRYKVIKRRKKLHNIRPGEPGEGVVLRAKDASSHPLEVQRSFTYEQWMAGGHLELTEESYGCAECGVQTFNGTPQVEMKRFFGEPYYKYTFIAPRQTAEKSYTDSMDCHIQFRVARHELLPTFKNNASRLDSLRQFVAAHPGLEGTQLAEVSIKGYASPEGGFDYNKALTERRAATFAGYLKEQYPVLTQSPAYSSQGMGEDWLGLRRAVAASSLPQREKVIAIIDTYATDLEREDAIRRLDDGATYAKLLHDFYPPLRRSTLKLRFNARTYADSELEGIFRTKPQALSAYEMYRLAEQLETRGESSVPVYEEAYKRYPNDKETRLNLANALLKHRQDANRAITLLQPLSTEPAALYALAIAHDMRGEWQQAEQLLRKAAETGHPEAKAFIAE